MTAPQPCRAVRPTTDGDGAAPHPRDMRRREVEPALWDCFDICFEEPLRRERN